MTNVLRFPLERVRLSNTNEQWVKAIAPIFAAHDLTDEQKLAFVKHVDAYRFDKPHAHPSTALAWDLWERFENEHLIREPQGAA